MRASVLLLGIILGLAVSPAEAKACGGCFQPQASTVDSLVTGHRMAFAVSADRTVLWDQIQYTGNPSDFGWVLPVEPGATVELAADAWFESLEAATSTRVTSPTPKCVSNTSPGCFGSSSFGASADVSRAGGSADPVVNVLHQGSLGPFDTVTLRSTDAGALRSWLSSHGYAIQEDVNPIIDAYVSEQMDFIALRLNGSAPMQPVRVVTPNGHAVLPLRMVMAGTGTSVDVVLYAIADQRLGLADLTETHLDTASLTFDFLSQTSNYPQLRQSALEENFGASFLTTFAAKEPFSRQFQRALLGTGGTFSSSLGQLYFDQGIANGAMDASECSLALRGLTSDELIATHDDAGQFACGSLTDLAAAMQGMHPNEVWLSRMEMILPREALSMDCRVNADAKQTEVSSDLTALRSKNSPCAQPLFESRIAPEPTSPAHAAAWTFGLFGIVLLARRVARRR